MERVEGEPQISVMDGQVGGVTLTEHRRYVWCVRRGLPRGEVMDIILHALSCGSGLEI